MAYMACPLCRLVLTTRRNGLVSKWLTGIPYAWMPLYYHFVDNRCCRVRFGAEDNPWHAQCPVCQWRPSRCMDWSAYYHLTKHLISVHGMSDVEHIAVTRLMEGQ